MAVLLIATILRETFFATLWRVLSLTRRYCLDLKNTRARLALRRLDPGRYFWLRSLVNYCF
jgi:hypothetical protein